MKKGKIIIFVIFLIFLGGCIWFEVSNFNKNSSLKEKYDSNDVYGNKEIILELKELTIKSGEEYSVDDFVTSCSGNCVFSHENSLNEKITDVGEYNVVIIARDGDIETKANTKLIIMENDDIKENIDNSLQDDFISDETKPLNETQNNNQNANSEKKDNKFTESNNSKNTKIETNNNVNTNNTSNNKKDVNNNIINNSNNNTNNKSTEKTNANKETVNQDVNTVVEEKTQAVTKVDTKTETTTANSYKYGTTIINTTTITYDIYSDGSKKEVNRSTKTSYDYSTFNGTTSDLKSEASSLVGSNSSKIKEVINYTNQYRSGVGVDNLTYDSSLSLAATIRALEMGWANSFSHTRPDGRSCFTILSDLGISYYTAAENIAWGYSSPKSVSEGWKKSSGHYANMINYAYTKIGVGLAVVNGNYYWVQIFG